MAGFGQYIKDTQNELHHVAWPTRTQTVVYTLFVVAVSVFTALYLGIFDYLFTSGLGRVVDAIGHTNPVQITRQAASTSATVIFSTSTSGN